ncbi:NAD(P)/FAD-dependent oxidoreductase, partial [Streptococcus suis]|uniref:NAD(P)/FAD-dependent oxidoreductase n=1 Tax=Streptococcus suis TaxID=1307 RepID=UPI00137AD1A0
IIPNLSGIEEASNLFTLRNVPDLDKIMAKLDQIESGHAIVIGAGFIGLEMAENLALKGLKVTLVEQAPHVLPTFDLEMARYVEAELTSKGVKVITG